MLAIGGACFGKRQEKSQGTKTQLHLAGFSYEKRTLGHGEYSGVIIDIDLVISRTWIDKHLHENTAGMYALLLRKKNII